MIGFYLQVVVSTKEIGDVCTQASRCLARDHNLTGVVDNITIFSLKTRDDFLFLRSAFPINFYRIRAKKYKHIRVM